MTSSSGSSSFGESLVYNDDETLLDCLRLQQSVSRERLDVLVERLKQDAPAADDLSAFWTLLLSDNYHSYRNMSGSTTTTTICNTDNNEDGIPIALRCENGKRHVEILMKMLQVSRSQAVELTCLTLHNLAVTAAADDSDNTVSFLQGLIGTQILSFHCLSVHYSQRIARIQCLTELLRIEQDDDAHHNLMQQCKTTLDNLSSSYVFSMLIARLVLPPTYPTWEDIQPLLAHDVDDHNTNNMMVIVNNVQNSTLFYKKQECSHLLDCLLTLLYRRFCPCRKDLGCLIKAFAQKQFFQNNINKRLSHIASLICIEAMGLWRATTGQQQQEQEQLKATPETETEEENATSTRRTGRKQRRRQASTPITVTNNKDLTTTTTTTIETSTWIRHHPLLVGLLNTDNNDVLGELEEIASIIFASVSSNTTTQIMNNDDDCHPQSVVLLSFGLLLRLVSLLSSTSEISATATTTAAAIDFLAIHCVRESNDTLGGFDYLQTMIQELLVDSASEIETLAYASILLEVTSALLLGFYQNDDFLNKSNDIQFICRMVSMIFYKRYDACILFWNEYYYETRTKSATTILLHIAYTLAEQQHHGINNNNVIICQLSPFITLLSSLCCNSFDLLQYATSITTIQNNNKLLVPPRWISTLVVAISDYYTPQQLLQDDVVLWIDKALEALKDIASVYPTFVRRALMSTTSSTINVHVQRIYRISTSTVSLAIAANATLLLSHLCSSTMEEEDDEGEESIRWTMEVVLLLLNNNISSSSSSSSFGVFTELSAEVTTSAANNEHKYLHYMAILRLVRVLALQLPLVVAQHNNNNIVGNNIMTTTTLCRYIQMMCDGYISARATLSIVLKHDYYMKSILMVANVALETMQITMDTVSSMMDEHHHHEEIIHTAIMQTMFTILCLLSSVTTSIGMFATLPVSLGWFMAMHQYYDSIHLKKLITANDSDIKKKHNDYEHDPLSLLSDETRLKIFAGNLRSDLSRIHFTDCDYFNNDLHNLIWTIRTTSLNLLHTWASMTVGANNFASFVKASSEQQQQLTPCSLLRRSVIDDFARSFLFRLLKETETTPAVKHYNSSQNISSSSRASNTSVTTMGGGLNVDLVLRYKYMLPVEVSCISQLVRYIESTEEIRMNDGVVVVADQIFELMQFCLVGDENNKTTSSVIAYQAFHGGLHLHRILSRAFEAKSNHSTNERLVRFATNALDSNEVSLCSAIMLGHGDNSRNTCRRTLGTMMDALKKAADDEPNHVVACSIASCIASIWTRIRSTMQVSFSEEEEEVSLSPRNTLDFFVSLLVTNTEFWSLLMRLIARYTSSPHNNNDEVTDRLAVDLVTSCIRIITIELHLSRTGGKFKALPNEVKKMLFCESSSTGNPSINMCQWAMFFTNATSVVLTVDSSSSSTSSQANALSSWKSFLQVYFSIKYSKESHNNENGATSSSGFFPCSQTRDIVLLLATVMCSWGNVSIEKISTSSEKFSMTAVEVLLENSTAVAEILVTVLSFCLGPGTHAYLVDLVKVADKCLHLIQLTSAQLFPLATPKIPGYFHHGSKLHEIGCKLRLRLITVILLLTQCKPRVLSEDISSINKQKEIETRICLVDLVSDTLHLLSYVYLTPVEGRFNCLFSSRDDSYDLLKICIATLTALLPSEEIDPSSEVYMKKLVKTLTRNKCLDVMTRHLIAASRNAYLFYCEQQGSNPNVQSEATMQYNRAIAIFGSIVKFTSQLVIVGSHCPGVSDIDVLGYEGVVRAMTVNPLIENCCKKWYSWSTNKGADMSDFRGYTPLQERLHLRNRQLHEDSFRSGDKEPMIKPRGWSRSIKLAKDDEAHHIWIQILKLMASVVRISRNRNEAGPAPDFHSELHQGSVKHAIDFICCYDYAILSALQPISAKEPSLGNTGLFPSPPQRPSASFSSRFTRNGLSEACACLSLVSELCYRDDGCSSLFERTSPDLYKALVDASLSTLQQLASFLGSASAARDLYDLVEQFRALESGNASGNRRHGMHAKSPTSDQRVALQLLCLHPLLANGVPTARHDAITNSHYVSSKCACMTELDCQLNSQATNPLLNENLDSPGSSGVDSFQLHVNNAFTAQIEELAAGTVYHAITVIMRAHSTSSSFVPFDSTELASANSARFVKVGTIIAVRPEEEHHCLSLGLRSCGLPQQDKVLRYAEVVEYNAAEGEWLVQYLGPGESDTTVRITDKVSLFRLGGIIDMDKMKTMLAFTPSNLKAVVERRMESEPSIGHLMLILQWCKQQSKGASMVCSEAILPRLVLESLAGRASQLIVNEIDLVDKLIIKALEQSTVEINKQLLQIFGGDVYNSSSFYPANEEESPFAKLVGKELWDTIQALLKHRLASARGDLDAARAKLERSPGSKHWT